jgi:hypothetical protein
LGELLDRQVGLLKSKDIRFCRLCAVKLVVTAESAEGHDGMEDCVIQQAEPWDLTGPELCIERPSKGGGNDGDELVDG